MVTWGLPTWSIIKPAAAAGLTHNNREQKLQQRTVMSQEVDLQEAYVWATSQLDGGIVNCSSLGQQEI